MSPKTPKILAFSAFLRYNRHMNNTMNWRKKYQNLDQQYRQESQQYQNRIAELEALVKHYEERFRLASHKQFGKSSENTPGQLNLFDEAEVYADPNAPEPEIEEDTVRRKKRQGKREEDFSVLPVEVVEHELPEDERICPECGNPLHVIGKNERKELKIIPAKAVVVEHVQYIYGCRGCEKNGTQATIVKAPTPKALIPGGFASASSVAYIMVEKYDIAVPLNRQQTVFGRLGIPLSRQTMSNWIIYCAENWLSLFYDMMHERLLHCDVLHADETVVQVLHEPGKAPESKSYMWQYRTGSESQTPIVLFEYQPGRGAEHPKRFLDGFKGYLHCDGYAAYRTLPNVTIVGCWAHVRRKFHDALQSLKKEEWVGSKAAIGLQYCDKLFALERAWKSLTPEERFEQRLTQSLPLAKEFVKWGRSLGDQPKSPSGAAVKYLLSMWPDLEKVYRDGRLEISNNSAERIMKAFAVGRKNWLFSNSQSGARSSAVVYSLIETAKENGLDPFGYLVYLFETLPNMTSSQLDDLDAMLPWSKSMPSSCYAKTK